MLSDTGRNCAGEQHLEMLETQPRKRPGRPSKHWLHTIPCRYLDSGESSASEHLTPSAGHQTKISGSCDSNVLEVPKSQEISAA